MNALHELRSRLSQEGILICFNGPFSHSIIEELGKAVKKYLENEDVQKGAMMDVFSVYIEATQNVRNYGQRCDAPESQRPFLNQGIIVIGKEGDRYVVSSGNLVTAPDAAILKERLEALSGLDKATLKARYKEQMRRELPDGTESAGLGLIDMARKASQPLGYDFSPDVEGLTFFSLRVTI